MYELSGCNKEVDDLVFENSIPGKWFIDFDSTNTSFYSFIRKAKLGFLHINHVCHVRVYY